jgi:hypothetical protein
MVNSSGQIPEPNKAPVISKPARPATPRPEYKPKPEEELKPAAQVTLSPRAREASQLAAKAKAAPEVRPERVQEAREKVGKGGSAAGQDAKIAEKLLTEN